MMNRMLDNEQTDRDNEVKNYGISLTDPATLQQYQAQYQSVVPMMVPAAQMSQVPPVQVPEQSLEIYDPESGLKSTSAVSPYGNPIYQQFPVPVPMAPVKTNPYGPEAPVTTNFFPQPVIISENINNQNNMNNVNNINLQQEEQFEDFGTIQVQQISGDSPVNAKFRVTCKSKNGQEYCSDFDTNFPLKTVACDLTNNLGMPGDSYNSWQFYDSATLLDIDNALLWNFRGRTINVKRKKRLAEIGNNYTNMSNANNINVNNMSPYDLDANNANNNDAKFTLTKEDFKKEIINNDNIQYV